MAILSVKNITRKFGALAAVDNVSLDVEEGEIRGLIGPNGAGKTTLFNLISGFDKPTRGTVRFRNRETSGLKPSEIVRMGLVRTFQLDTTFKEMTVFENVLLAQHLRYRTGFWGTIFKTKSFKKEHATMAALAEEIVESCGLTSLKGEQASKLPHGNQRVLGLAIALSAKPSLLCLDEPSAGLTPEETGSLMSKLREVNKQGITLIIFMRVLAIETSCDDTGAAVILDGRKILSNIVSSQIPIHQKYGGVVPELASRKHIESIVPIVTEALEKAKLTLKEIDGIAVTQGPGLVGSLLVGLSFAKSIAFATGLPFIGVNHIEAHLSAIFLEEKPPRFPFIGLVVSGGHTSLFRMDGFGKYQRLGQTRDDAAGEAFDKVAKLLGLGYPGGPIIDELSKTGNPKAIRFPRPVLSKNSFDFSFSGLKTAVVNYVKAHPEPLGGYPEDLIKDIVSSFQEAAVDVLVKKTVQAAQQQGLKRIVLSGGVAANQRLRQRINEESIDQKLKVYLPSRSFCTDNAAMVGVVGYEYLKRGVRSPLSLNAFSNLPF